MKVAQREYACLMMKAFFCENLAKTSMSVVVELLKVKGKRKEEKEN